MDTCVVGTFLGVRKVLLGTAWLKRDTQHGRPDRLQNTPTVVNFFRQYTLQVLEEKRWSWQTRQMLFDFHAVLQ